jgi:putative oxidoreductase
METSLEIIQGLLSAIFSSVGIIKTYPVEMVNGLIPWTTRFPVLLVRFIGIGEIAFGIGLILPMATQITPVITSIAALGLLLIMCFEMFNHIQSRENKVVVVDLLLLALLLLIVHVRLLY